MNEKLAYFLLSMKKMMLRQGMSCPSCGWTSSACVSRKYFVTTLRRCDKCKLLFRAPTTSEAENKAYYQSAYQEGFTTEMPAPDELDQMKRTLFKGSPKDFHPHVDLFRALGLAGGSVVLDYGCSWGYGSWQFMQAGFSVKSFEISKPRREYARQVLGVDVVEDLSTLAGSCDLVFSSHVLEHVPAVESTLKMMLGLLRPGGFLVALTPCGSMGYRDRSPASWDRAWGFKHPNFLDDLFYQNCFSNLPYYIATTPSDLTQVREWSGSDKQKLGTLDGSELLAIVKKQ